MDKRKKAKIRPFLNISAGIDESAPGFPDVVLSVNPEVSFEKFDNNARILEYNYSSM
jgi:hypothetical protein